MVNVEWPKVDVVSSNPSVRDAKGYSYLAGMNTSSVARDIILPEILGGS